MNCNDKSDEFNCHKIKVDKEAYLKAWPPPPPSASTPDNDKMMGKAQYVAKIHMRARVLKLEHSKAIHFSLLKNNC